MNRPTSQISSKSAKSFLFVLSMFILGNAASGQESPDCSESKLVDCRNVLIQPRKLPGMSGGPVFSQDQIHRTCGALVEADQCVLRMYQLCPELQSVPKPPANPDSIVELQKCHLLLNKYVHKLGCYDTLNSTYQRCLQDGDNGEPFQKNIDRVRQGNRELQQEGCCNIRRVFDCILIPTGEQCDREAMSIMEDFLHLSLPTGMSSTCMQFKCLDSSEGDGASRDTKHHPENGHEENHVTGNGNDAPAHFRRSETPIIILILLLLHLTNKASVYVS